jgi:hypothetical protein
MLFRVLNVACPLPLSCLDKHAEEPRGDLPMKDAILWLLWIPASMVLLVMIINTFLLA